MENKMKEIANMFGVELGEMFIIIEPTSKNWTSAMIKEDGLHSFETKIDEVIYWKPSLEGLLKGEYIIKTQSYVYKPKFNERYYSIGTDGDIETGTWLNDFLDYTLYKIGNCYRTPEAAKIDRNKWGTFYSSDEVLTI